MNRFALLAAAVLGALTSAADAQPRGRAAAPAAASADDDGPEATGVALFKLDDIIEVAVRLSPDVARARADRDIARNAAVGAGRSQAWVMSAAANFQSEKFGGTPADGDGTTASGAGNQIAPLGTIADNQLNGSLSLGRNLPTGGNLSLELGIQHDRRELNVTGEVLEQAIQQQTECSENVDIFCTDQAIAKLTFKQPIARGFGSEVALADQRKADLSAVEATVKAQIAAEEMIRDVVIAYWELAYAAHEVDTRAESLQAARDQETLTRQEMRAGTAGQSALDSVTYEIAIRDEALLTSKLELEKKSMELRRKVGLEIGRRDIVVRPADPLEIDSVDWNVDDVLAKSHKINRQLANLILEKKIADVDVDVAHDQTLPQIDLTLSGALTGNGNTQGEAFGGLTGSDGARGYQVVAGLQVSFELSGAAKANKAAAVAKRQRLEVDRLDLERQIDAQVTSAVKVLQSGKTRIALADKAIRIANENLKAERASFLAQRSTNFNVMQRQTQVFDAELRRGRAVADYRSAAVQLQYLSGTLLDTYRIRVRDGAGAGKADAERDDRRSSTRRRPSRQARADRD